MDTTTNDNEKPQDTPVRLSNDDSVKVAYMALKARVSKKEFVHRLVTEAWKLYERKEQA